MLGFMKTSHVWLASLALLLTLAVTAPAAVPTDPAKKAALIGQPASLLVQPANLTLSGPRAMQQVIVTGKYADGSVRDLTAVCDFAAETADVFAVSSDGYLRAKKNGTTALIVKAGGQSARV